MAPKPVSAAGKAPASTAPKVPARPSVGAEAAIFQANCWGFWQKEVSQGPQGDLLILHLEGVETGTSWHRYL